MKYLFLPIFLIPLLQLSAQNKMLVSGPMLCQVELRTARIWVELGIDAKSAAVRYWKKNLPDKKWSKSFNVENDADFKPVQVEVGGLEINTSYQYAIVINNMATNFGGEFTTKDLWQFRKPPPGFSFLAGSCTYINEPIYDRPGKPYGGDSSIFEVMAKENASFMIWLGDNWYTREADYFSEWGLWYRASHDRSVKSAQKFLKAMPHYAIWDDHDYGPNDGDKSYILKEASRKVFMNYWGNPSYGQNNEAIYSKVTYSDCDFFLMDDRWFRSADDMDPFIDGKPNTGKRMWGEKQLEWLKTALINSKNTFKFIVTGSQTLNPASPFDCLQHYPAEFNELMTFLVEEKINGVLFLTGDRHHSEVVKYARPHAYDLYDITSSPLTSGIGKVSGKEKDNPARVEGTLVEAPNYARISVTGPPKERVVKVEFIGLKGETAGSWSIGETNLKMPVAKNN